MTDTKAELQYVILSRAWYGDANLRGRTDSTVEVTDCIHLGKQYPDGGCDWEASIDFLRFDRDNTGVKFELFNDGWQAFAECPQLFTALASLARAGTVNTPTVDEIAAMLQSAGFTDKTPTVDPSTIKRSRAHATA